MKNHLKQFLTDYLIWAESGDSNTEFNDNDALCGNITPWVSRNIPMDEYQDVWLDIVNDLTNAFRVDGLDTCYPFGGSYRYYDEMDTRSHHRNELRLAWVRKQLEGE